MLHIHKISRQILNDKVKHKIHSKTKTTTNDNVYEKQLAQKCILSKETRDTCGKIISKDHMQNN